MEAIGVIILGVILLVAFSGLFYLKYAELKDTRHLHNMEDDYYATKIEYNLKMASSLESAESIRHKT